MNIKKETIDIKHWLKISAISLSSLSLILGYTKLVFSLGVSHQYKETAIEVRKKFHLTIENLQDKGIALEGKIINIDNIFLAEYLVYEGSGNGNKVYKLHRINPRIPSDIKIIGSVSTDDKTTTKTTNPIDFLQEITNFTSQSISNFSLIEIAHAQQEFNWYGYEDNYDFQEKYTDEYTVRRSYDDGAILEYKIDLNGSSIPESFKWIERPSP